ncbi:MAG: universal stress protein [Deltaproteobacteria bacterium]|nr:universal stress protein [Deltaproteobacteria bacterium]
MPFIVKRILVATDFSEPSRRAADAAVDLARSLGAGLVLVHVTPLVDYVDYDGNLAHLHEGKTFQDAVRKAAQEAGAAELARLKAAGANATFVTLDGPPTETLCTYAEQNGVDLIVVGTHGRTGIQRLVMGSVAETVVRHARVPVLAFRGK